MTDKNTPLPQKPPELKVRFTVRHRRLLLDILGALVVVLGLITALGLLGLTTGGVISPWVERMQRFLGWGSFLGVIFIIGVGSFLILSRFIAYSRLRAGRVLLAEGIALLLLAFLDAFGDHSLTAASAGKNGGVIGWVLNKPIRQIFPAPWDLVIIGGLLALLVYFGFGLNRRVERRIERWLFAPPETDQNGPMDAGYPDAVPPQDDFVPLPEAPMGEAGESVEDKRRDGRLPKLSLLFKDQTVGKDEGAIHATAGLIERTLLDFGIPSRVVGYRVGPTVTQFAVEPGFVERTGPDGEVSRHKVRVSQISALSRDLALALSAERLRIEAPVPGQSFVGIEVPNDTSALVRLRSLQESPAFQRMSGNPLAIALGRDVSGQPVVADLGRMPHLLIAGTTGSGKSVCIAALAVCLMMNNTPDELRLALLDPKMVELVRFNGLPHLMGKVETDTERMLAVLRWALAEMDRRYRLLEAARVKDLQRYNRQMRRRGKEELPRIVIMIDELADLMMSAPDQTEHSLVRLAQLARATGIHLVVATQRPSTDVVTGLIKANFPARLSFTVASSVDSRVILDTGGAETLLGRGDMLYQDPEAGSPIRAQGVMVTDQEVELVVSFWQQTWQGQETEAPWEELVEGPVDDMDALLDRAVELVRREQHASASMLQRKLRVGYPRAARLIDDLEDMGVVGPSRGGGKERDVLIASEGDEVADVDDEE
ncbi:MAG: DNA translocase FtsK [Anaerolineaceae bacterium]|jgi:S-DNA-T family DNA segregation ATPase FtsK/SpoIIIE|nr:DNA translocase FtsK [Anaerolineaceae bacterium]